MKAEISEIFYSIQGEGIYQFMPQVFVRFWGCNMDCVFCDTKKSTSRQMDVNEVLQDIHSFKCFWDSVALTGGEPLLQIEFLQALCQRLKEAGRRVYLETNGILYKEMASVVDFVDVISLDFKLPSSTNREANWSAHYEFLKIASQKNAFVKAVVTPSTTSEDIIKSAKIIQDIAPDVFFVLQPAFSYEAFLWSKLDEYRMLASEHIAHVRVISQMHKHIGVR